MKAFKRLITPANKPQGFGFVEFEDPDSALRCMTLLQGVELPALEDGCANKKLLVRPPQSRLIPFKPTSSPLATDQSRRKDEALPRCLLSAENEDGCTFHSTPHFRILIV